MARNNFETCLGIVLSHEGGWSNHRLDPGGSTNQGITLRTYRRAWKQGLIEGERPTKERLRNIPFEEVQHIYREMYWGPTGCRHLAEGVDLMVFDAAVNQGPGRAVKFLQRALNERNAGLAEDGVWGPNTRREAANYLTREGIDILLRDIGMHRLLHYSALQKVFQRGWFRRLLDVFQRSIRMALDLRKVEEGR